MAMLTSDSLDVRLLLNFYYDIAPFLKDNPSNSDLIIMKYVLNIAQIINVPKMGDSISEGTVQSFVKCKFCMLMMIISVSAKLDILF